MFISTKDKYEKKAKKFEIIELYNQIKQDQKF